MVCGDLGHLRLAGPDAASMTPRKRKTAPAPGEPRRPSRNARPRTRSRLARTLGAAVPAGELRVVVARIARGRAGPGAVAVAVIVLGLGARAGRARRTAGAADMLQFELVKVAHKILLLARALGS